MLSKTQEKVQVLTNVTTPTGASMSALGALTFNEWLTLGGFLLALGSFGINWYYQHKRYQLMKSGSQEEDLNQK